MRVTALIILLLFLSIYGFAQKKLTGYIEIKGRIDNFGDIKIDYFNKPKQLVNKIDSLIDYLAINKIISGGTHDANKVLNALSIEDWALVSVMYIPGDKNRIPATPFILYYLKRDFLVYEAK